MIRQVSATTRHDLSTTGRLRFQLPAMWLAAVLLPSAYVYAGFITVESEDAILITAIASAFASLFGLVILRRVRRVPGTQSYAFILPSLAATYGLALVLIFGLRLAYSRTVITASFVVAVLLAFIFAYLTERFVKQRFYLVPGGDADTLRHIENAEWVALKDAVVPPDPRAMLVADFRHPHSGEWERMLAQAAIAGRVVYHSKLLNESLTGKVRMEHLSENSFGSLIPNLAYRKLKRGIDLVVCLILGPILLLPLLAIALAIRLDSSGPAIFRQQRVGYRGEVFEMLKFRTMRPRPVCDDDETARRDAMTRNDDDRITRVGRFLRRTRLDELPQIVNILRGEMSWIGPRPEAVPLSRWYETEIPFYSYRHIIRPGITGWAQVHQGHVTDLDEIHQKLAYDFYYVKYFSAWLDIVISLRTIPTMIGGFGAR